MTTLASTSEPSCNILAKLNLDDHGPQAPDFVYPAVTEGAMVVSAVKLTRVLSFSEALTPLRFAFTIKAGSPEPLIP